MLGNANALTKLQNLATLLLLAGTPILLYNNTQVSPIFYLIELGTVLFLFLVIKDSHFFTFKNKKYNKVVCLLTTAMLTTLTHTNNTYFTNLLYDYFSSDFNKSDLSLLANVSLFVFTNATLTLLMVIVLFTLLLVYVHYHKMVFSNSLVELEKYRYYNVSKVVLMTQLVSSLGVSTRKAVRTWFTI